MSRHHRERTPEDTRNENGQSSDSRKKRRSGGSSKSKSQRRQKGSQSQYDNHRSGLLIYDDNNNNSQSDKQKQRKSSTTKRRSRERDDNLYMKLIYIILAAYVTVVSFDYYMVSQTTDKNNDISRRKLQFQTKPIDKNAKYFIKTGQLPGAKSRSVGSVSNVSKQKRKDAISMRGMSDMERNEVTLKELPPISTLIDANGKIVAGANISGLLDFSIIGFPKTGTTSLLRHLSEHTISLPKEHCDLANNDTAKLVKDIYDDHDRRLKQQQSKRDTVVLDGSLLRGIKCPQDISSDWSMHNYAKHFPKTKLIIGVRHPIFWFQSLYNFRISNVPWKSILHTSKLTRGCPPGSQGVCAWRANFADFLARLGKTPLSPSELKLLSLDLKPVKSKVGAVFLYDLSQLSDKKFRKDLKDFLGLTQDIPPIPQIDTSGRFDHLPSIKKQTSNKMIDICDKEHDDIRLVLMEKAERISSWIIKYFLKSEEVYVSNRPYFESVIKSWMHDPCG